MERGEEGRDQRRQSAHACEGGEGHAGNAVSKSKEIFETYEHHVIIPTHKCMTLSNLRTQCSHRQASTLAHTHKDANPPSIA